MSKLAKLRNSPEQFFADSKNPWIRRAGSVLVPTLFDSELVMEIMEDPAQALVASRIPGLTALARRLERRRARRRHALFRQAGEPTVSVVMAAHNASATVEAALASVLDQSYPQLEVIVIDDASSDDTADKIEAVVARDERVRLVRSRTQQGAAMTRNIGLHEATGAYLSFHDSDDVSHPEKIERQLGALLARPDAVLCVCNFRRQFADGSRVIVNGRRFGKNVVSMVFPRDPVFNELGYMMDMRVGEDTEYYERMRSHYGRDRAIHLFQTLYFARFAEESLLFSHADMQVTGNEVTYERDAEAERFLEIILERMDRIRSQDIDPYVGFDR